MFLDLLDITKQYYTMATNRNDFPGSHRGGLPGPSNQSEWFDPVVKQVLRLAEPSRRRRQHSPGTVFVVVILFAMGLMFFDHSYVFDYF